LVTVTLLEASIGVNVKRGAFRFEKNAAMKGFIMKGFIMKNGIERWLRTTLDSRGSTDRETDRRDRLRRRAVRSGRFRAAHRAAKAMAISSGTVVIRASGGADVRRTAD
jgi:hypothetical protein